MTRFYILSAVVLVASAAANAGQIEIGQYVGNSASGATQGLTAAYFNGTASCVGAIFQGTTCAAGSTTGFTELNYKTNLFGTASSGGGTTFPTPYSGYSATSTSPGKTASGGGANFAMINDTTGTQNEWSALNTAGIGDILTIPVGILDVNNAWLMLSNEWGVANENDTDVFFTFGTTSTGGTTTTIEEQLNNAPTTVSGTTGGQIQSAVSCTSSDGTPSGYANCQNFAGGSTSPSSTPTTICNGPACADFGLVSGTNTNGITVLTSNVYTFLNYTNAASMNYTNTSGNVQLDDQQFNFGTGDAGLYLVSIGVAGLNENTTQGGSAESLSVLSAATINTFAASTPEPSTWMLLMGGIGLLGIGRLRRRLRRRLAAASSRS